MKKTTAILLLMVSGAFGQERINGVKANISLPGLANTPSVGVDANGKLIVGTGGGSTPAGSKYDIQLNDSISSLGNASHFSMNGAVFDAAGSPATVEAISNTNFASGGTGWSAVGDFALSTGAATYTDSTHSGTITITPLASAHVYPGQSYTIAYHVSAVSGTPACGVSSTYTPSYNIAFPFTSLTVGDHTLPVFIAFEDGNNIAIHCTSSAGQSVTFSSVSAPVSVSTRMFQPSLLTGGSLHLQATGQTAWESLPDANYHRGYRFMLDSGLEGMNYGFSTISNAEFTYTQQHGFNNDTQSSKLTMFGINSSVSTPASGQRFGMSNYLECWGMGDCFGQAFSVVTYGGLNGAGDEGSGHNRNEYTQGQHLTKASIVSIPTQSTCKGTITQDVQVSTEQLPQWVGFNIISGGGTCLKNEFIDIDKAPVYYGTGHEVIRLAEDYANGKISAIFGSAHLNRIDVSGATCAGYSTATITASGSPQSISFTRTSGTCNASEAITVNRGWSSGLPAWENTTITTGYLGGTISAVFAMNHLPGAPVTPATVLNMNDVRQWGELRYVANLSATKHAGTIASWTNRLFTLNDSPGTAVAGGDPLNIGLFYSDEDTYSGFPFSGSTEDDKAHSFYGVQSIVGSVVEVAHKGANGFVTYSGKATPGGAYHIVPGTRVWWIDNNSRQVVLDNNTFLWTVGDTLECALSVDGNVADTNFYSWWLPGATLYNAQNILNTGARTFRAGFEISGRMPVGSNSDAPWAWGSGISIDGAKTGISIQDTKDRAIEISYFLGQDLTVTNKNVCWGNCDLRIGPNGNALQSGQLALGSVGPTLDFGNDASNGSHGKFQLHWPGIITSREIQVVTSDHDDMSLYNATRIFKNGVDLVFQYYDAYSGPEIKNPFTITPDGPVVPAKGTAISGTNYGSNNYTLQASIFAAPFTPQAFIHVVPESNSSGAELDFQVDLTTFGAGYYPGFWRTPLHVTSSGKLSFGLYDTWDNLFHRATLDASALTAARTYAMPDLAGTVALTGAAQDVTFGAVTASGLVDASAKGVKLPTACTGLATGTLYNNAGAAAFCP